MSLMVDDQVRSLNAKLPSDERESALTIIEHSGKKKKALKLRQSVCDEHFFSIRSSAGRIPSLHL